MYFSNIINIYIMNNSKLAILLASLSFFSTACKNSGSATTADNETDSQVAESPKPTQGIWEMIGMDDEGPLLEIRDDEVDYYEYGFGNMPQRYIVTNRTDSTVEFQDKKKRGLVLFTDNFIDLQIYNVADGEMCLSEQSTPYPTYGGLVSRSKDDQRTVYSDTACTVVAGLAEKYVALPIISLHPTYTALLLNGKDTVCLPNNRVGFDYAKCNLAGFGGMYESTAKDGTSYEISDITSGDSNSKKQRFKIMKNVMEEFRGYSNYYLGHSDGNRIVVDSITDNYDAFENADGSKFTKLDKPFDIMVYSTIRSNLMYVDSVAYRPASY